MFNYIFRQLLNFYEQKVDEMKLRVFFSVDMNTVYSHFIFFFLIDCCTFREVNSSSGLYGWVLKTFIYFICTTSMSEKDWKDYFICTGPDSILVPVVVKPEEDWRGAH